MPAKKPTSKKPTSKKAVPKKPTSKKPTSKKPTSKKPTSKKAVPKLTEILRKVDADVKRDAAKAKRRQKQEAVERAERKAAKLTPHVVVFLDLLGFRDTMIKAVSAEDGGQALLTNFQTGVAEVIRDELVPDPELAAWKYRGFTDNFVLATHAHAPEYDHAEGEFGTAAAAVSALQLRMALAGWFVRGGVSYGQFYMDDIAVFGQPLVDAYIIESTVAVNPRVVLSAGVRELIIKQMKFYADAFGSPQNAYVLDDGDGHAFINYLYTPIGLEWSYSDLVDVVKRHKAEVEKKLAETSGAPKVMAKFMWVAGYHNFFCEKWLPNDSAALMITTTPTGQPPPKLLVPKPLTDDPDFLE